MHFLNIMIPDDVELVADKINYTIIDWMNTRLAPAVFDYARRSFYLLWDEIGMRYVEGLVSKEGGTALIINMVN